MKKIFKTFIILGLVASSTSCKKYLDVNTNPNDVTTGTPEIILPQALAATGALANTLSGSTYGADLGGYIANAGGVSGFGNFWTFKFNSGDATGVWTGSFDNLQDYQYILNNTNGTGDYKYYNAIARLMKAYDYLNLVDAYGDVPYTQALQGTANLLPAYDKGSDVYKACIAEINTAIASMKSASTPTTVNVAAAPTGKVDVFVLSPTTASNTTQNVALSGTGLDMTNWIRFANTVKLRALLHIQTADAATFATEKPAMLALAASDFVTGDVLCQPGYVQQSGKQTPEWNSFAYSATGSGATASFLPSTFVTSFYNGTKLTDDGRGKIIYRDYTHSNQLGFQSTSLVANPKGGEWYTGPTTGAISAYGGLGVMKGYDMGQPILTAAESYFLQAEGSLIGLINGTTATLFNSGVLASFQYLDKDHTDVVSSTRAPATELTTYQTVNTANYLVNFALATTNAQKLEAIITQKYIALNFVNCDQGWNDYRRTFNAALTTTVVVGGVATTVPTPSGYPKSIAPSVGSLSTASSSFSPNFATIGTTRSDGLAGRILYPSSETSYNTAHVPVVDVDHTLVFWDARP